MTFGTAQSRDRSGFEWSMKKKRQRASETVFGIINWPGSAAASPFRRSPSPMIWLRSVDWQRTLLVTSPQFKSCPLNHEFPMTVPGHLSAMQPTELVFGQCVPLSDLSAWVVADLAPVLAGGAGGGGAQEEPADDRCAGRSVGVQQQQLHAGVSQAVFRGQVENEELVEDGVGGGLFHMRLLLTHSLLPLEQVHLHVRV